MTALVAAAVGLVGGILGALRAFELFASWTGEL